MNIAFLSSLNPRDIHNWSGTLYYMYHHLEKDRSVTISILSPGLALHIAFMAGINGL